MSEDTKKAPVQTLRDGAIVVKIWEQNGKTGPYVAATLGRTYKNEQTGEYGESRSLSGADVLKAQALLGEANKEMILWREYRKEIARQQQGQDAPNPEPAENRPDQGLVAQRDQALAKAAQPNPTQAPENSPDRGPER